jgi:signal transduction histidine kinase
LAPAFRPDVLLFAVERLAVPRLAVARLAVPRLAVLFRLAVPRLAVVRLAVLRLAVLFRLAVPRLAVVRFAVLRLAVLFRLAVPRFAVVRFAVLRLAVVRFAVVRFAVVRFAVVRFAVLRLAVLRLAVLRFAADFLELRGGMPHLLRGLNYPAASAVRSSMSHPPDGMRAFRGCDGPRWIALRKFMLQLSMFPTILRLTHCTFGAVFLAGQRECVDTCQRSSLQNANVRSPDCVVQCMTAAAATCGATQRKQCSARVSRARR